MPDKTFHVNVLPIPGIPAAGLVLRDAPVPLGSDTLSGITIDLHVGETKIIYADVMPSNTTHGEVQWTSANTSLVSMGTPLLQAGSWLRQEVTIRAGSTPTTGVTISAHVDGVTPDKTFTVNVLPGAADGIALKAVSGAPSTDTITGTMIHLQVGETKKIYADVTPSNTINGAVTMTSADGDKVTVTLTGPTPAAPWTDQEWTITGKALTTSTGPVIITANAGGGTPDKTFFVQVQPIPVTDITGVPTTVTVGVPLTLSGTVEPADATYRTIAWSITNAGTTGATISGDTANTTAPGDYTVTGTISNGLEIGTPYTKSFPVSVLPIPVSSVTVAPLMLGIGESSALSADVQPANATYRTVTWTSETPGVATVNPGTGEVTGVAQGTAVIRATADGQSGTCTVAVVPLLPYAQVVEGPASGNGLSVVGFRDWHYVLEWKREPTGIPLDANYDTTVVIPALEAALVTWNEYSKRIDPLPYYESSSRRVYDVIFSSSHDLDNGGGKQIVLNRYWPEFADDTVTPVTNRTTWLASENTRKAAFKKAVAEMKAMMAVIEKSPLYTAGDLSNPLFTLYSQMDEFTKYDPDPSDEEFEQRFIFTEANVSPTYCKAEVDSNLDYPDKSSPLYEYYLGCVPDIDGYVDPYGPFAFPGTGP
ncbi:hypothetical protein AGMMS4952_16540 [Spirochaetia bacterium]|nr:hypothetical protein AGMMS4952_16540 [Spirochaetia bacterium]